MGALLDDYYIDKCDYRTATDIIIKNHYLHRKAPCSMAFCLKRKKDDNIFGIIMYGVSCSSTLLKGICGKDEMHNVYELTRLWVDDSVPKNGESYLIGRNRHRFPNLCCMKISGWHKSKGDTVSLLLSYKEINRYDLVYISKVFTDTKTPDDIQIYKNVKIGGTGFFFDDAENLPDHIEHCFPDYNLYNDWINSKIQEGSSKNEFKEYTDYSIGFLTRGCFRKCGFCVNKKYDNVFHHSYISEFLDNSRKKICLLDDNFFGYKLWEDQLSSIKKLNKPFKFKQGMDERIMNDHKCRELFSSKYDGDFTFAFDNIDDKNIIIDKLNLIKKYTNKSVKFYILCGFDRNNKWDYDFWIKDIIDTFERIKIIMSFGCLPYIMRFNRYNESPFRGTYINLSRWCNQPNFYKKMSYREFCIANLSASNGKCSAYRYMQELIDKNEKLFSFYLDMKFNDMNKYPKERIKNA